MMVYFIDMVNVFIFFFIIMVGFVFHFYMMDLNISFLPIYYHYVTLHVSSTLGCKVHVTQFISAFILQLLFLFYMNSLCDPLVYISFYLAAFIFIIQERPLCSCLVFHSTVLSSPFDPFAAILLDINKIILLSYLSQDNLNQESNEY